MYWEFVLNINSYFENISFILKLVMMGEQILINLGIKKNNFQLIIIFDHFFQYHKNTGLKTRNNHAN
jgi:hypothetical protein